MTITARRELAKYIDDVLENVAWAESGTEAAQQIEGELGWRPPARVLDGDPEVIEAALDALPDRAVVTSESLTSFDAFLKQPMVSTCRSAWYQAGVSKPFDAGFLARYYSPLVVLR